VRLVLVLILLVALPFCSSDHNLEVVIRRTEREGDEQNEDEDESHSESTPS